MRILTHIVRHVGCAATVAAVAAGTLGATARAAEHPRLVSLAGTRCTTCHDDLLKRTVVHAPADDDCTACHDVTITESGTTVALTASEPGLCITCHDGLAAAAEGTLASPHAAVMDSCLGCHAPHASDQPRLLNAEESALCSTCHEAADVDTGHALPVSRARCLGCHRPHGSATPHMLAGSVLHAPFGDGSCEGCHRRSRGTTVRLARQGAALCFGCHGDLEGSFTSGSVHTPVRQGRCVECHDPHMSDRPGLARGRGAELCFGCHRAVEAKVKGPGGHAAAEDCSTCHDPHRSPVRGQLTDEVPGLCLSCHTADAALATTHLGADLEAANCLGCHDPHGSATRGLIATGSVHPPFEDGCDTCHEGAAATLVDGGASSLCYACHGDVEEAVQGAAFPHGAMAMARCVDCHSPHASRFPRLLRAPAGGVCTPCHEDAAPTAGQFGHGAVDWFGCQSCHEPHGGSRAKLLRGTGNPLCNGCHLQGEVARRDDGSLALAGGLTVPAHRSGDLKMIDLDPTGTRNHPVTGHPVSGPVGKPEGRTEIADSLIGTQMTCVSCHDPHKGASADLFAYGAASGFELCLACHPR